jgi:hypothetical protein
LAASTADSSAAALRRFLSISNEHPVGDFTATDTTRKSVRLHDDRLIAAGGVLVLRV